MKIKFRDVRLSRANLLQLNTINEIVEQYQRQGYKLTLRQLYYQLVSRDLIPNKQSEYVKVSNLLKEGRMGGLVDWDAIEDRLRKPDKPPCWDNPAQIVDACIRQYRCDRMKGQDVYLEVWVEKDALSGVLKRVTSKYGIPIIVNRGYSSATAMYDAHERFVEAYAKEQLIKVIYIGDFDPSGQDMIRDISDRISEFYIGGYPDAVYNFQIVPIALLWDQIQKYNPPPNPAKTTDPRAKEYISKYGPTSWEVDALNPELLNTLLTEEIEKHLDVQKYEEVLELESEHRNKLRTLISKL